MPSALTALLLAGVAAPPPGPSRIDPLDERALGAALWVHGPELAAARVALADAQAGAARAHLLPNPVVAATWGTIPIGGRNPESQPFWQVPNYSLGVAQLFEIGKRQPRQEATALARDEARLALLDLHRTRFFDLQQALGVEASARARAGVLVFLVESSAETLRLQRLRAEKGDLAPLEVDRLEVEHVRLVSSLAGARAEAEAVRAACARILGESCPTFGEGDEARLFLERAMPVAAATEDAAGVGLRPDVLALTLAERRAAAEGRLAASQAIPDPTVSTAIMHDQFVASGNQANSVAVSVSLPLPLFDRGQPERIRSDERARWASTGRSTLIEVGRRSAEASRKQLVQLAERAHHLDTEALPLARAVTERMTGANRVGGVATPDVLLARRAMEELELDRVEVELARFQARLELRRAAGAVPLPEEGRP